MNIYRLFGQFNHKRVFGDNLGDALLNSGPLTTPSYRDPATGLVSPAQTYAVTNVYGRVDTSNSTRGDAPYSAVIVDLTNVDTGEVHRAQVDAQTVGGVE